MVSLTERFGGRFLDIGGAVYNVRHPEFGAKGDGRTDDTAAIRKAVETVPDRATVLVPPGRYLVSGPVARLSEPKWLTVRGAGNASELVMAPGFGPTTPLIELAGRENERLSNLTLAGLRVSGHGDPRSDGIALALDRVTNVRLVDLHVNGVRNTALRIARTWDAVLDRVRVFGCGGGRGSPAVYIGNEPSAGLDNVNSVHASQLTVERSFGTTVRLENLSNVTLANSKLHGRAVTDTGHEQSEELLHVSGAALVTALGCLFAQARTGPASGAVRVDGPAKSTLMLVGCTFSRIGPHDGEAAGDTPFTHAVYFDSVHPESRLLVDDAVFNYRPAVVDGTERAPYIRLGPRAPAGAVGVGTVTGAGRDPADILHDAAGRPTPARASKTDGGVFRVSGNAAAPADGTILLAFRPGSPAGVGIRLLRVDVTCGSPPGGGPSARDAWVLVLEDGTDDESRTATVRLAAGEAGVERTPLPDGGVHFGAAVRDPDVAWPSDSLVRARLARDGDAGEPPADVNVILSCAPARD